MPNPNIIKGNNSPNPLNGTSGVDHMYGYGGNDTLLGYSGDDILDGGVGADTMMGGTNNDTYYVDNSGDKVVESKGEGRDTVRSTITYALTENVEVLILEGGDADIDGFGNSESNDIYGNYGDNALYGGDGQDALIGNFGDDRLYGGNDMDILIGGQGHDTMVGGDGNDTYYTDGLDVIIEGGGASSGWDTVRSSVSHVLAANVEALVLEGGANADGAGNELDNVLTGNAGSNMLFGYAGDDTLDGGSGGADTLFGGADDDTYYIGGNDHVIEHAGPNGGIDRVYSFSDYAMEANIEILQLTGAATSATGNNLANTIVGNMYDNIIDGGALNDNLSGGAGNDTFVFRAGEANGDAVYDFTGNGAAAGDVLEFEGYGPGATFQQLTATEWRISSADGSIQDTIVLIGAPALDASDWHFT
jgi:Ca2+-binding RTX toxin-like protein